MLFRPARRPGPTRRRYPGARSGDGALVPPLRSVRAGPPASAAVVGIRKVNSRGINDLERQVLNWDGVPPGSPARFRPGAGIQGCGPAKGARAAGGVRLASDLAAVGIPRTKGRGINDLERRMSNPDAVPPTSPARFRPGAGVPGARSGEGRSPRRCVPSVSCSGERRRSGYSENEGSQNQRLGTPSVELGRCSANLAGPVPPRCGCPGARSGEGRLPRRRVPSVSCSGERRRSGYSEDERSRNQ